MSFSTDVHRIAEKMGKEAEEVARSTFIHLFNAVIKDTPVDSGRLRGNWQTTRQTPASGTVERKQKERTGSATAQVQAVITKPDVYYLTNNMPYAERIEYGYSRVKAPEGMVRKNIIRLESILKRAAR